MGHARRNSKLKLQSISGKANEKGLSKREELNRSKVIRDNKILRLKDKRSFFHSVPKNVLLVPLCKGLDMSLLKGKIEALSSGKEINYVPCERNILEVLRLSPASDFFAFVVSTMECLDVWSERCRSCVVAQGFQSFFLIYYPDVVCETELVPFQKEWMKYFDEKFPTNGYLLSKKLFSMAVPHSFIEIERILCQNMPKKINWRDSHPYMISQDYHLDVCENTGHGTLMVTGHVRGKPFSPNMAVHLHGLGDYGITRIEDTQGNCCFPDLESVERPNGAIALDPSYSQSINDRDMQNDTHVHKQEYQHVTSESFQTNQCGQSDESICTSQEESQDIYEREINPKFRDEVALLPTENARERFGKYCALDNFKSGSWNPLENLPNEYATITQFENETRSFKSAINAIEDNQLISVGCIIKVFVENVPISYYHDMRASNKHIVLFGLLMYETKLSVINFTISPHHSYEQSIESRDDFVLHLGFRRYFCNPIFSENASTQLKRYHRVILPEDKTNGSMNYVGSIYAHTMWGNPPALLFKCHNGSKCPDLVAVGHVENIDPQRLVIKRITLVGAPCKINKKSVVVKNMFFNPEDIEYFKLAKIYTPNGRVGHIKDSIGTHGHMKCIFNKQIQQSKVGMHLYKRVFPKMTTKYI